MTVTSTADPITIDDFREEYVMEVPASRCDFSCKLTREEAFTRWVKAVEARTLISQHHPQDGFSYMGQWHLESALMPINVLPVIPVPVFTPGLGARLIEGVKAL